MPEQISAETRQRILDAAIASLEEDPMVALRLRDVAARAGVSTSAIYKAFANKYELFAFAARAIHVEQVMAVAASVDEAAAPIDIVEFILRDICELMMRHPFAASYVFVVVPVVHSDEMGDEAFEITEEVRAMARDKLRDRLAAAVASGDIHGDPAELVEFCMMALYGYVGMVIIGGTEVSPEQFARRTVAWLQVLEP